jgi:quinoprotein glucose dehydrogenase
MMHRNAQRVLCTAAAFASLAFPVHPARGHDSAAVSRGSDPYRTWSVYNGGPDSIHYSRLTQINPGNVRQLLPVWTYETGDAFGNGQTSSELECNPIVIDGVLYATTPKMRLIALDAADGKLLWNFNPHEGHAVRTKQRSRGVTYWAAGNDRRIFTVANQYLYALDARTGTPVPGFGISGRVDLREGLGRDPEQLSVTDLTPGIVYKDLIILGSTGFAPGDIRAFDARTGEMRWSFHTIPHPGEPGFETWPQDAWKRSNGANNWAGVSLDEKRGLVFVPTGSGGEVDKDFYGADRIGDNLFADTLLALDASTGRRVWHFQVVHHDIWDRDLPAPPSLVSLQRNGRPIDAVAQITKSGLIYVFDRQTGKPLFPVAERRYRPSIIPGELAVPTQPFPLAPAPYARQELTRGILTRRTAQAHAAVLARFEKLHSAGQFVPPDIDGAIIFPGLDGGGEWGGAAFDPQTGLLYVNSNEMAWILKLRERPAATSGEAISGKTLFIDNCSGCHGVDRAGSPPEFPSLIGLSARLSKRDATGTVSEGSGRMPGFARLGAESIGAIADYILYDLDEIAPGAPNPFGPANDTSSYVFAGYTKFLDPDGYPAVMPPWGTLSAIDLNTGKYAWRIPFGEYPELAAQGMKNTGSENYGGAVVTASGLLFIGATVYDRKLHAFDKRTGSLLWETVLPAAGNATPALYEVNDREYLVIAAGGGKDIHGTPGGAFIAFALPNT